ncbi:hypothetical protein BaRGS_00005795 [Batillaria attramentaria]|uniref:Epidermal retinol dehydrogenase 2 n=1 Tax=Batillaria attramentaria TaxID=370345 RepID=A0ABD0LUU1_9CAEN
MYLLRGPLGARVPQRKWFISCLKAGCPDFTHCKDAVAPHRIPEGPTPAGMATSHDAQLTSGYAKARRCISVMSNLLEAVWEMLVTLGRVVYFWLEAIFLAFVPTSFIAKDISGQTVLVTGAGSGIGRLLALEFASHSCRVILWDVNTSGNEETARLARKSGATVRCYTVDVSDREQFLDCPDSMIVRTMQVNAAAHFWTVKAFLPNMISRNHGHIVTVASSAGLLGVVGLADYCSSKFGAVGFEESLRFELETLNKDGVHTTLVCPYLIATGMFDGCKVRFPWLLNALDPEYVSSQIVDAVLRNQQLLILPRLLYVFMALKGFLPVKCVSVICDYMGASHMMDTFKGRKTD